MSDYNNLKNNTKHKLLLKCFLSDSNSDSNTESNLEYYSNSDLSSESDNFNYNNDQTLNTLWIEKYRPISIKDLVLDPVTLNKINKIIETKNMQNLIIVGVPGIGKTSTILCIAKTLFGKYYNKGVLELNASDERGVKTVQEPIEYFCKKKLELEPGYSNHKIVLLDEADNMTKKAQQLINNLMEHYEYSTRFAFTCNNSSDIIEAIQSRCIIFRFYRISNDQIFARLEKICKIEQINYTKEGLDTIITIAQGDLRQAINNLQLTYNGYTNIIPNNVYKLCDHPHPLIIRDIILACQHKNIRLALKLLDELREKGYSSSDISTSMKNFLKNADMDEEIKIKFMEKICATCIIISKGLNTKLQLSGTIASLCQ